MKETFEEEIGKQIVEYCKNYEGTDMYNAVILAIEYGYQLALKNEGNGKQETLEDKLKSLVEEWRKRQEHYIDIADRNLDHEHTYRKFTYKAMATRDCWKELLKLIENGK